MPWQTVVDARTAADALNERITTYLASHPANPSAWSLDSMLIADVVPELDPLQRRRRTGRKDRYWRARECAFYTRLRRHLDPVVYSHVCTTLVDAVIARRPPLQPPLAW
jgi:hypothetical protein